MSILVTVNIIYLAIQMVSYYSLWTFNNKTTKSTKVVILWSSLKFEVRYSLQGCWLYDSSSLLKRFHYTYIVSINFVMKSNSNAYICTWFTLKLNVQMAKTFNPNWLYFCLLSKTIMTTCFPIILDHSEYFPL